MSSADSPLSAAVFHILLALAEEERHGYAIMREAEALGLPMGPGTLYGSIARMISHGLIEEAPPPAGVEVDERRRYYRITERGRGALEAESARMAALVQHASERGVLPISALDTPR